MGGPPAFGADVGFFCPSAPMGGNGPRPPGDAMGAIGAMGAATGAGTCPKDPIGGSGPSMGPLPGGGCMCMDIGIEAGTPPGCGPSGGNGPSMGGPPEDTGLAGAMAGANGGGAIAGPDATGGTAGIGAIGLAIPRGGGDSGAEILGGPPPSAPSPADRTGAPHPRQKRISSGLSLPHRGQLTFTNASDHWNCLTLPAHETQPAFEPDGPQSITRRPSSRPQATVNFQVCTSF
jgi:hypothetical protein